MLGSQVFLHSQKYTHLLIPFPTSILSCPHTSRLVKDGMPVCPCWDRGAGGTQRGGLASFPLLLLLPGEASTAQAVRQGGFQSHFLTVLEAGKYKMKTRRASVSGWVLTWGYERENSRASSSYGDSNTILRILSKRYSLPKASYANSITIALGLQWMTSRGNILDFFIPSYSQSRCWASLFKLRSILAELCLRTWKHVCLHLNNLSLSRPPFH